MKRNKYDILFSKLVRARDEYTCQRCGREYPDGGKGLHCSHYMGRTNSATRWDLDNAEALCYGCHAYFEDRKQTAYRDWKIERHGEEFVKALEFKSRGVKKWTPKEKEEMYKQMKEEYKKYGD